MKPFDLRQVDGGQTRSETYDLRAAKRRYENHLENWSNNARMN